MSENRIELFDFLRGLAIFLVIINHVPYHSYNFENQSDYIVKNFLLFGTYGVQLFYIVSACTLFRSIKLRDEKNFKAFFIRRFFRIAPIFYIGIICHVIYFNDNFKNDLNFTNIFLNIFFINNFIPPAKELILGGQTITTEMNFYIFLPILVYFIKNSSKAFYFLLLYLVFLILLNECFTIFYSEINFGNAKFYRTIFVQLFVFLYGINLYFFLEKFNFSFKNNKIDFSFINKLLPYILISILILIYGKADNEFFYFRNMFLVSGFFFILIIFTFVLVDYLKFNTFFKLFVKLGQVSFSAYIFHWIIIDVLKKIPISSAISEINLLFFVIFSVMFTYFISLIFFRIETFFISLGKKVIKRIF